MAATLPLVKVSKIPGGHFGAYGAQFTASAGVALDWLWRFLLDHGS